MRLPALLIALLVPAAAGAQMGQGPMRNGGGPMMMHGVSRHAYVMQHGIDPRYAHAHNPLKPSKSNIADGKRLYRLHCVICHGDTGEGSEAGLTLEPPVQNLAGLGQRRIASDAFYDWTVSEGGVPLRSAMPPFKNVLSQQDIWKIILYLRTL
jgi:mono/diheme cytochrome c family protein